MDRSSTTGSSRMPNSRPTRPSKPWGRSRRDCARRRRTPATAWCMRQFLSSVRWLDSKSPAPSTSARSAPSTCQPPLSGVVQSAAILFASDRLGFAQATRRELGMLAEDRSAWAGTALETILDGDPRAASGDVPELVVVSPLSEAQRKAVASALVNPVTVVTWAACVRKVRAGPKPGRQWPRAGRDGDGRVEERPGRRCRRRAVSRADRRSDDGSGWANGVPRPCDRADASRGCRDPPAVSGRD